MDPKRLNFRDLGKKYLNKRIYKDIRDRKFTNDEKVINMILVENGGEFAELRPVMINWKKG